MCYARQENFILRWYRAVESDQHNVVWEHRQAELWDRIFQVTQDVVEMADSLADTASSSVLKGEMVKAAMAVGQQLVRATASDSRHDFLTYLEEAKMKAVEADYWLRLAYVLQQREDVQRDLSSIINQYSAIVDLLQKMRRHVQGEANVLARHARGPRVSS